MPRLYAALLSSVCLATAALATAPSTWTPAAWTAVDTVQLTTNVPGEGAYAFPVWPAVVDGQLYVRLGDRAAKRVTGSTDGRIGVEIAGARFERARCEPTPDLAPRVGAEMARKYWSDVVIRYLPHPLTCRLVPE